MADPEEHRMPTVDFSNVKEQVEKQRLERGEKEQKFIPLAQLAEFLRMQQERDFKPLDLNEEPVAWGKFYEDDGTSNRFNYIVGFVEEQNRRYRKTMEDGHVVVTEKFLEPNDAFFAVYDGHGGKGAMTVAVEVLHVYLQQEMGNPADWKSPVIEAYRRTDCEILERDVKYSGCTAATAMILTRPVDTEPLFTTPAVRFDTNGGDGDDSEKKAAEKRKSRRFLVAANAGDARVVLVRNGKAYRLTVDHKCDDPVEVKRITDAGGFVYGRRVSGILAVARALGDHAMKQWISGEPHVQEVELCDDDEYLIVACDGLFDVFSDQQCVEVMKSVENKNPQAMARKLMIEAIRQGTTDNLSVMVVALDGASYSSVEHGDASAEKTEPTSPDGGDSPAAVDQMNS